MPRYQNLAPALYMAALLGLAGCGVAGSEALSPTPKPVPASATSLPPAPASAAPVPQTPENTPMPDPSSAAASAPLSPNETAALVQAELAASLQVAADTITVVATRSRVWPDRGLGCAARPGQAEPERIPGYEIVLAHAGSTYTYHSDEHGRAIRCPDRKKPIGPIS